MVHFPGVRIGLYLALARSIFSIILLALTATRISDGFDDGIVIELLVTSILAILWSWLLMHTIHSLRTRGPVSTFRDEIFGFLVIWILYLVGTAISTNNWANLSFCFDTFQCRLLSAIVAFAWLNFITATLLGFTTLSFFASHTRGTFADRSLYGEPLHGKWGMGVGAPSAATAPAGSAPMAQNDQIPPRV